MTLLRPLANSEHKQGQRQIQLGLEPKECPNWKTYGKVQAYDPHEIVKLQRVHLVAAQGWRQVFRINPSPSRHRDLKEWGDYQEMSDLGIEALRAMFAWSADLRVCKFLKSNFEAIARFGRRHHFHAQVLVW